MTQIFVQHLFPVRALGSKALGEMLNRWVVLWCQRSPAVRNFAPRVPTISIQAANTDQSQHVSRANRHVLNVMTRQIVRTEDPSRLTVSFSSSHHGKGRMFRRPGSIEERR